MSKQTAAVNISSTKPVTLTVHQRSAKSGHNCRTNVRFLKVKKKSKFNKLKKSRISPTIIQYEEKPKLSGITPENKPGILQDHTERKAEKKAKQVKQSNQRHKKTYYQSKTGSEGGKNRQENTGSPRKTLLIKFNKLLEVKFTCCS